MNTDPGTPAELADAIRHDFKDVVDGLLAQGADPQGVIPNESRNPDGITVVWSAIVEGKLRYVPKLLGKGRTEVPLAIIGALGPGWPDDVDEAGRRDIDVFEMLATLPRNLFRPALDALLGVMSPESPELARALWRLSDVLTEPEIGHPRARDANNITDALHAISVGGGPVHLPRQQRAAAWHTLFSRQMNASGLPSGRWGASFLSSCLFAHGNKTAQMLALAFADGLSPEVTVDGHPLLILAVGRNNTKAVEVILEAGADLHRVHEMQMGHGAERGDAIYYATSNACVQMLEAFAAQAAVKKAIDRGMQERSAGQNPIPRAF